MSDIHDDMNNDVATEDPVVESQKTDLQDWTPMNMPFVRHHIDRGRLNE